MRRVGDAGPAAGQQAVRLRDGDPVMAAADAGIIALSLARAPMLAATGRYWVVPSEMHPAIEQGGAIMKWTTQLPAAEAFRDMLLGPDGQAALARFGFSVIPDS